MTRCAGQCVDGVSGDRRKPTCWSRRRKALSLPGDLGRGLKGHAMREDAGRKLPMENLEEHARVLGLRSHLWVFNWGVSGSFLDSVWVWFEGSL